MSILSCLCMLGPSPEDSSDGFQPGESKFPCASCHPSVPSLPHVIEGGQSYIAQCILDVCWHGHGLQLLVNWEGYGPEEGSWIPWYHILDKSLLCDFYQDHPNRFGSVPGGPHWGGGTVRACVLNVSHALAMMSLQAAWPILVSHSLR